MTPKETVHRIRCVVKRPRQKAHMCFIAAELEELQRIVGGYIEELPIGADDSVLICNEEGKPQGLEPNVVLRDDIIVGPVILARVQDDELVGYDGDDARRWMEYLDSRSLNVDADANTVDVITPMRIYAEEDDRGGKPDDIDQYLVLYSDGELGVAYWTGTFWSGDCGGARVVAYSDGGHTVISDTDRDLLGMEG